MNKRILVTGAAGFIGSHLCEKLIELGYRVSGIDNFDPFYPRSYKERNIAAIINHPSFEFIEGDLGNPDDLDQFSELPDAVIHLAAKAGVQPSLNAPSDYIHTNILLTNHLLEWMNQKGVKKLVFASSSSVYGNTEQVPFAEDQPVDQPVSPYAFTKRSCELMNYTYHDLHGFDIINLRFFTVYGERQRPDLAIHKFVSKIIRKEAIHLYGDGSTSRDYTYWKDTVSGITAALRYIFDNNTIFEIINLGNNKPVKLIELVEAIAASLGLTPQLVFTEKMPGDVDITYADINKAGRMLQYAPACTLEEGLKNFVVWYKQENNLLQHN
ncbi:MAG: NAD-dependent epimerase/dehydratase family protein [Bacteroidota bacterium]|nr:NAD-dependent epimerase/dehydratase family protein [Bacteroidota bacterium]